LLFHLGLDRTVVGITKFCIHPPAWLLSKTVVGGTKNFQLDTIDRLRPDLIIGNKEENYEAGVNALSAKYPVWMSDVVTVEDALAMIHAVAGLVDLPLQGERLANEVRQAFQAIKKYKNSSVLYLIWRKPWMAAGAGTFIDSLLKEMGLINAAGKYSRYPVLSAHEIGELKADYIFLSSEPYPFRQQHLKAVMEISPNSHVLCVDGEFFSWYGSRLRQAPAYFNQLL
jgi:ABC-type Fe3+-hydroxamate transport system substrate-binding protein